MRKILAVLTLLVAGAVAGDSVLSPAVVNAAPQTIVDQNGEDDLVGQKDLNSLTVDYGLPGATSLSVSWNWDDTATSGANTRDACTLFDTDGDGFANYAFCLTVNNNTTVSTPRLYVCTADSSSDRCGGPTEDTTFTSTGTTSVVANSDPFRTSATHQDNNDCDDNPACNTADSVAITTIQLADFGAATATLLNVCSFPSQQPNSDPSDCVIIQNSGFIRIVKDATPNTTATFSFTLDGTAAFTTNGDGSSQLLPVNSATNHSVSETAATGWQLSSASCVKGSNGAVSGTLSGTTISGIDPSPGEVVTCTFNNAESDGTLTLVKVVDNLGESGPGYLGVSDFPLTIDGNSTTSGTAVTVTAGNHAIAETSQPGYTVGTWSCTDGNGAAGSTTHNVAISGAETNTCTITNTLIAVPALSIVKTATPSTYSTVGAVISYSYLVTNSGNVTLSGPFTVSDDKATDESCPATASLAPTASITCTASFTVTQADLDSGSVTNVASASNGTVTSPTDTETVTALAGPALDIVKTATPTTYSAVGQVISYSYAVTNTGNVTLSGPFAVSDDKASDEACPATASLAPTASITCTASYTVTQADLDSGSVTNVASATNGTVTSPTDTETVTAVQSPALSIVKTATPTTYSAVGAVISYSYLVTNSGNVTLSGPFAVSDDKASDEACPATVSLAPGASITCTASFTITQADLDSGSVTNIASASNGTTTSPTDTETVTAVQSPALSIVKTATPTTYSAVGAVISYSYLVTNSGNVTLSGPFTVSDDKASDEACPATVSLAPTASITCTASYTVTQADLDSGSVTNIASASNGTTTSPTDTETVTAVQSPALSIVKTATPTTYSAVGAVISYSYLVTNSGNVTLSGPFTVTDDKASDEACPATVSLAPGASITCTASFTITQADLDSGSVTNVASASNGTTTSPTDTQTVNAVQSPALSIVKTATPTTYSAVGAVISYSYLVTNSGNVTLSGPFTVSDDKAIDESCPATASLAPTASITCTASYTITQADLDAGSVTNVASASNGAVTSPTDTETVTAIAGPALDIVKTATPTTYDSVGDVISYSYLVTNSGNVTLSGPFTVSDDKATDESCPATASLAPGASITCTASFTITQADLDAGSVTNIASASNGTTTSPTDTETVTAVQSPALSIVKTATPTTYSAVGAVISYSYLVTNSGNVTLSGPFTVSDDKASDEACPATVSLAPAASITCTASFTISQADLDSGSVTNVASATNGTTTSPTDTETVTAVQTRALSIVKTATPSTYSTVGAVISYSYLVTNSGNVTLSGPFTVSDDKATDESCPATVSLAPGASITCTASYTVTQADLDAGSVTNVASATNGTTTSPTDTETVTAVQTSALSIVKTATPLTYSTVGAVISYSYLVTNSGNVTLSGPFTVTDDKATDESCPATPTLAPGASITCTASYTITQADLDAGSVTNIASASNETVTSPTDTETVTAVQTRALSIVKTATPSTYSTVGAVISYSYLVTNSGNVTLSGPFTVTDDKATDEACPATASLAPGASITCTASYTITQADLDSGSVTNVASATNGTTTSPTDTETVTALAAPALDIVKTATPTTYSAVGQLISYSYAVTNTGNVTLSGPFTVSDDKATDEACPATASLAPGASITCTASFTISQADLDAGSVTNVASASNGTTTSPTDTETVTAVQSPALSIVKTATPTTYSAVGAVISYSYAVTNTGNVTLSGPFTVSDDKASDEACPATVSLAPGASITCTASFTITQADLDSGSVTNIASASNGTTTSPTDTETVTAVQSPALSIVKTATPTTYSAVGAVISYSYLVTNSGNVTLSGPFTVTDDKASDEACPATVSLAPGASITCTASYTVTQADLDSGSVTNIASASNGTTTSPTDTETVTAVQSPALSIVKTATPTTYSAVGAVISYSYLVTNSGNVTLSGPFTVSDDKASDEACPATASLAPTASITCTASYTITQADLDAGSVTNVASASNGTTTSPTDTETVNAVRSPGIDIQKTPDTQTVASGGTATFTIVVTNTGNVTLTNVSVSDPLAPDCNETIGTLAPGASSNYTCTHTVTAAFTNTATATGTSPTGTVTDSDTALVSLSVAQTAKIAPTATTCQSFRNGTAADLDELRYTVKGGKINAVSPGVLFYYNRVTVSAGATITVTQTDNGTSPALGVQQNQAILWSLNCTKVASGTVTAGGARVTYTNVPAGTYIIGIKYTPDTVKGAAAPGTVIYTFSTSVNGTLAPGSTDTIVLKKK